MLIGKCMWNEMQCNYLDCFITTFTYKSNIFFDFGDRICFWKYFQNDNDLVGIKGCLRSFISVLM